MSCLYISVWWFVPQITLRAEPNDIQFSPNSRDTNSTEESMVRTPRHSYLTTMSHKVWQCCTYQTHVLHMAGSCTIHVSCTAPASSACQGCMCFWCCCEWSDLWGALAERFRFPWDRKFLWSWIYENFYSKCITRASKHRVWYMYCTRVVSKHIPKVTIIQIWKAYKSTFT